ncbi:endonuclease III domain-containing protein [Dissulfurirhabdus thermomarina]|uniref:endonuclease III domain-containing protein n=1 Tax=Dissulfurirhabdus thermomarina TaxID=1765737 RepID=UPI002852F2E3|nr:endonuclease III domain-containing protein [Dissulfurirhabdus thermomarina]
MSAQSEDAPPGPGLAARLDRFYHQLYRHFGPQGWWPGQTPLEICVGAILTQNTNWRNVERAIAALAARGLITSVEALERVPEPELAELIRPAGYFNVKARRLKDFLRFVREGFGGDLGAMLAEALETIRPRLLAVRGIGPETADSILLYAGSHATFVVDAYTRRILGRHGIAPGAGYETVRELFMSHLPRDAALYNEYHALLVALGKHRCRPRQPRCGGCPLEGL